MTRRSTNRNPANLSTFYPIISFLSFLSGCFWKAGYTMEKWVREEGRVGDELGLLSLFGTARYEFLGATS